MKSIHWILPCVLVSLGLAQRPGDRRPVNGIHPGYTLEKVRPSAMNWPIGGMDFLSDGRLVVTSWKDPYGVFILNNVTGPQAQVTMSEYALGISEALGVKVVNDSIYVLQKDELTLMLDHDKDGKADEQRAIAYDWTKSVNEKEYALGLVYDGTSFYGSFGDPTVGSGTAIDPIPAGRQNGVLRMGKDGTVEPWTGGMRVPGGVGYAFGEVWTTETQGGFRPAHVLYNAKKGRFYGRLVNPPSMFQSLPFQQYADNGNSPDNFQYQPFSVNIPFKLGVPTGTQGPMRSPGNPLVIPSGPFKGQMFIPDCDRDNGAGGAMVRVFLEKTQDGEYQGGVFHFSRGFEGGAVFNIVWGPDGALYAAGNGSNAAGWGRLENVGLERLKPNARVAFEMLSVRSLSATSFAVEFTKPLAASLGADVKSHLTAQKWWYRISSAYGGAPQGLATLTPTSAAVSADRKTVTLVFPAGAITKRWVYYFRWADALVSDANETLWGTETWYTLNAYGPAEQPTVAVEKQEVFGRIKVPFAVARGMAGELNVQVDGAAQDPFRVQVVDLQGAVSATRTGWGSAQVQFPAGSLPKGLFVIRVKSGELVHSRMVSR